MRRRRWQRPNWLGGLVGMAGGAYLAGWLASGTRFPWQNAAVLGAIVGWLIGVTAEDGAQ